MSTTTGQGADPYLPAPQPEAVVAPYAPAALVPAAYAEPAQVPYPAAPNPYAAAPGYAAPASSGSNGLAITALVLSLIGFGLIGAILGHVAIGDATARGDSGGRTMCLIAIWVGWGSVALAALIVIASLFFSFLPLLFIPALMS